jgi:hypothetical protein
MVLELQKGRGIELYRRRQTFFATNPGSYVSTSSSQIRIEINIERECIDFENSYLMFDIAADQSGANTETLSTQPWEASSWIRDLRVYDRAGREIGEQVRNYNVMARKNFEMLGNDGCNGANNYLGRLEGAAGRTSANDGDLAAIERAHKFSTHIFGIKSYFPAHLMGGLIIELDMESASNCLFLSGTSNSIDSYTISNVRYVADLVLLKADAEAKLRAQVSKGLSIHYESPMNHSQAITTNTSQRFDLGIANGAVKKIEAWQVLDSARNAADEEYLPAFAQNNLSNYRFRLGSDDLTERAVQVSSTRLSEYTVEYLKANGLCTEDVVLFLGDSGLDLTTYFVLGQKVEVSKDDGVRSGRRDYQSNKIELDFSFSSAPSAATLYTEIMVEKTVKILSGKEFVNQ